MPAPDGVELLTDFYLARPLQPHTTIPLCSPYARAGVWALLGRAFAERGYHAVIQSCRGTFGSDGEITADRRRRAVGVVAVAIRPAPAPALSRST